MCGSQQAYLRVKNTISFLYPKDMANTAEQFNNIIEMCQDIFLKKMHDYGTAWRILRSTSITDQIFIKANRSRSIEEKGVCKVDEGVVPEFIGIINYSIMGLIQLELGPGEDSTSEHEKIRLLYKEYFQKAKDLMLNKNHDYGEAWRSMRISSYTDLILMKIKRTKQIEDHQGKTLISEGIVGFLRLVQPSLESMPKGSAVQP